MSKNKKDDANVVELKVPLYERPFRIMVTNKFVEAFDWLEEEIDCEEDLDSVEATVIESISGQITLLIRPKANINTICHESFHVTCTVLEDAGLKLCGKSEEAYAYLIGWVAAEIKKALKTWKSKN